MALEERLADSIHKVAPSAKIDVSENSGRLSGFIIADEFDPMTHLERQQAIWAQIRKDLSAESKGIGILLTYTPEEFDAVEDED